MPAQTKDRLHGTLDALILKTLSWGPRHGYAISRWLSESSGAAIQVEEGSLYPALYRMERERWIEAEWGVSELGRVGMVAIGNSHAEAEEVYARTAAILDEESAVPAAGGARELRPEGSA